LSRFTRSNETISSPSYTSLPPAPIELQKPSFINNLLPKQKGNFPNLRPFWNSFREIGYWKKEKRA
jgi:hypothetical protein